MANNTGRRSLVAAVTFLIIVGCATTGWIVLKEFQIQQTVYTKILEQKLEATQNQFRLFLNPFNTHLKTLSRWQQSGLLNIENDQALLDLVVPLLDATEQVGVAGFLPPEGPVVVLARTADGWVVSRDSVHTGHLRDTDWYQTAREEIPGPIHWSEYTTLAVSTESLRLATVRSGDWVLALTITENALDRFTAGTPLTENGILVRRFGQSEIVWLTPKTGNRLETTESGDLLTSGQPEHAVISQALLTWGQLAQPYQTPFKFRTGGATWWAIFYPALEGTDPGELGLIAPAEDLGRRLQTVTGKVTILLAAILGLAMLIVVLVAFDYRNKWRRFARRRRRPPTDTQELRELIAEGETNHVEFKSTLRWNLHADKAGKEIEIAWLKSVAAFLNTDGGFLLVGVADDGEVLGLTADQFANDDKLLLHFDNLVKQHLGLQFAGFIHASLRPVDGKQVLLVNCDRCEDPVFLKKGEEEIFFLRMGPSTRVLPPSKVPDYLKEKAES